MRGLGAEALLTLGRMKYRHVRKLALTVLQQIGFTHLNQSGSHLVAHSVSGGRSTFTLVEHHGSGDSVVPLRVRTRIFEALLASGTQALNSTAAAAATAE
jgi:predicted RNA binding protein YcfA (HicA-like mRNA interferase family)